VVGRGNTRNECKIFVEKYFKKAFTCRTEKEIKGIT
jgi:hypothetical protein